MADLFEIEEGTFSKYYGKDTELVLPDTVTRVGEDVSDHEWERDEDLYDDWTDEEFEKKFCALRGCEAVETIHIPASVTEITDFAFYNCKALKNIVVSAENNDYCSIDGILYSKDKKTLIFVPKAREGRLAVPDGITEIRHYCGEECTGLTELVFPEGVKAIRWNAFSGCENLEKIHFPESLTEIQSFAFWGCKSLTTLELKGRISVMETGTFSCCTSLKKIVFPEGLEEIAENAFYGCDSLTEVEVPKGVRVIRKGAFGKCQNLCCVTLPDGLEELAHGAFLGSGQVKVEFGGKEYTDTDALCEAANSEFLIHGGVLKKYCGHAGEVVIPDGVVVIGENAFCREDPSDMRLMMGVEFVERVVIPEGVETIETNAFYGCENLKEVVLPDSLKEIRSGAFQCCENLETVNFPKGLRRIGNFAFCECKKITRASLPEGLEQIGYSAFNYCEGLSEVALSEHIRVIEQHAFNKCFALKRIALPDGVDCVEKDALNANSEVVVSYKGREYSEEELDELYKMFEGR